MTKNSTIVRIHVDAAKELEEARKIMEQNENRRISLIEASRRVFENSIWIRRGKG